MVIFDCFWHASKTILLKLFLKPSNKRNFFFFFFLFLLVARRAFVYRLISLSFGLSLNFTLPLFFYIAWLFLSESGRLHPTHHTSSEPLMTPAPPFLQRSQIEYSSQMLLFSPLEGLFSMYQNHCLEPRILHLESNTSLLLLVAYHHLELHTEIPGRYHRHSDVSKL